MKLETIAERLNSNDRAVSPVIGVILMVAITVILAAVIGTFVLDLGQSAGNSAPSASLTVTTTAGPTAASVNISHKGGDTLNSAQTRVIISNGSAESTWDAANDETFGVGESVGFGVNATSNTWALDDPSDPVWIQSGDQVEVQVIDVESQRVIFETTVTA